MNVLPLAVWLRKAGVLAGVLAGAAVLTTARNASGK